jgi:hypothetical protein
MSHYLLAFILPADGGNANLKSDLHPDASDVARRGFVTITIISASATKPIAT